MTQIQTIDKHLNMTPKYYALTQKQLKEVLSYSCETGEFTWLGSCRRIKIGDTVGSIHISKTGKSYLLVGVCKFRIWGHRLAWFYVYGVWPDQIDHIDGDGLNNKWENLRNVAGVENGRNARMPTTNTSGCVGVYRVNRTKKWRGQIMVNQVTIVLYRGNDFFEAVCARKSAERKYGFHPNHGSKRPL